MFDPYHKWLAIPPTGRPPTCYQLLGISPDEHDPEVIAEAALRQTSHVRMYQIGGHADESTRLLNEIAQARTTLLNPARRKQYDARLGRNIAPGAAPRATPTDRAPGRRESRASAAPCGWFASAAHRRWLAVVGISALVGPVLGYLLFVIAFAPYLEDEASDSDAEVGQARPAARDQDPPRPPLGPAGGKSGQADVRNRQPLAVPADSAVRPRLPRKPPGEAVAPVDEGGRRLGSPRRPPGIERDLAGTHLLEAHPDDKVHRGK